MRALLPTALVAGCVAFASFVAQAQAPAAAPPGGPGAALVAGSGSSGVLTSSVIFAAHSHTGADGVPALDVLVLLRGDPGWYAHTPRGGSVLTGATTAARDGKMISTYWTSGGGFTVTFDADSTLPTLHLSIVSSKGRHVDEALDLSRTNVVLLDGLGTEDDPKIQTQWIDPRLTGEGTPGVLAIRKSPSLVNFVRCGIPLPAETPDEEGPYGRSLRNIITRACNEIHGVPTVEAWAGTWVLNLADSSYPPGAAPRSSISRLERSGDSWKMTTDGLDAQGNTVHTEITAKFDGHDYAVAGNVSAQTTYAFTKLDDHRYRLVTKRDGTIASTTTTMVSPDGRTRTSTTTAQDAQGGQSVAVAVYDRKE